VITRIWQWSRGFLLLTGVFLIGEFFTAWFGLLLPGSLIGMVLLTIFLFSGIIKLEHVEKAADDLLSHLILLFVPAAVGIMVFVKAFAGNAIAILLNTLLSMIVVVCVTGKTADSVICWLNRSKKGKKIAE
jgi:holin-like protein